MENDLKVCSHCESEVRVSEDIVFYTHWVGDYFLIDVLLIVEGYRVMHPLFQEVYISESAYRAR